MDRDLVHGGQRHSRRLNLGKVTGVVVGHTDGQQRSGVERLAKAGQPVLFPDQRPNKGVNRAQRVTTCSRLLTSTRARHVSKRHVVALKAGPGLHAASWLLALLVGQ